MGDERINMSCHPPKNESHQYLCVYQLKTRREDDANLPSFNLILTEIVVKTRYVIGNDIEEDTSCN